MGDRRRNWVIRGGAAAVVVLALAGCGSAEKAPQACPPVLILADAERLTQYRPGGGRDITDIEVQGEIAGFRGACQMTKTTLDVTLAVAFMLQRGPADTDGIAEFKYFVAIPDFYPDPRAKAVLPARVSFPEQASSVRFVDDEVTLSLPRRQAESESEDEGEGASPAAHAIYLGFQLDEEQLRRNRDR